jgi:hypothetical protein
MTDYILDRLTELRLIILKENTKPHIEKIDYITYQDMKEALINDINYKYISTELGFFEIFYKHIIMEILITKRNRIQNNYVTTDLEQIESLTKRSKIIKFKTIFDESDDKKYISRIDMITYNNERISIHNMKPWQHEIIFQQIEQNFIIKDEERLLKTGIIFQDLIVKAILISPTIYLLRKIPQLDEDIILQILYNIQ